MDYWTLESKKHQPIFLNTKSSQFSPTVVIFDEDGRTVAQNSGGGVRNSSLIAVSLRSNEAYTIGVSFNHSKGGKYEIRALNADWEKKK